MIKLMLIVALLVVTAPAIAQFEGRCTPGKAANNYESWIYIANNARRTADEYAIERNPNATFVTADVDVIFQFAGEHKGNYLVKLLSKSPVGTSFAMLKPNFEFCADPSKVDDESDSLFEVVEAKFNGRSF